MRQQLTQPRERLNSYRPAKQRRALLESNPPRDSWIERRRNKNVSTFGEAKTSSNAKRKTFIPEPEHALKNSSNPSRQISEMDKQKPLEKTILAGTRFFEASPLVTMPAAAARRPYSVHPDPTSSCSGLLATGVPGRSFHSIKIRFRTQEKRATGYRGRSHEPVGEFVFCEHFKAAARRQNCCVALLITKIEPALRINR